MDRNGQDKRTTADRTREPQRTGREDPSGQDERTPCEQISIVVESTKFDLKRQDPRERIEVIFHTLDYMYP